MMILSSYTDNYIMKKAIVVFLFLSVFSALFSQVYKTNVTISYYAEAFHGKKTSNGERFNMNAFTCAHKTLPFNTILKVTNLSNGKSVEVRVNDRGPFVVGREADMSKAAAVQLGMIGSGTCKAKIEIIKLGPNNKLSQQTAASAAKMMAKKGETISTALPKVSNGGTDPYKPKSYPAGTLWDIQIGAFSNKEKANVLAQKLLKQGFKDVTFQKTSSVVRVILRSVPAEKIPETEKQLREKGYYDYVIRQRKSK